MERDLEPCVIRTRVDWMSMEIVLLSSWTLHSMLQERQRPMKFGSHQVLTTTTFKGNGPAIR